MCHSVEEIVATHVEESASSLNQEGIIDYFVYYTNVLIEYLSLVESSQTHHRSVHHQYYVKREKLSMQLQQFQ